MELQVAQRAVGRARPRLAGRQRRQLGQRHLGHLRARREARPRGPRFAPAERSARAPRGRTSKRGDSGAHEGHRFRASPAHVAQLKDRRSAELRLRATTDIVRPVAAAAGARLDQHGRRAGWL
eukprot:497809-Prymnesium_polylepis.1